MAGIAIVAAKSFYYIADPGLGLWMHIDHPHAVSKVPRGEG